jgi:hypothetical protein
MTAFTVQASQLADLHDLAWSATFAAARCKATGLDVRCYAGIIGTARILSMRTGAATCPWSNDTALVAWIYDTLLEVRQRLVALRALRVRVVDALARAERGLREAQEDGRDTSRYMRIIADCRAALEIITAVTALLIYVARRLSAVPAELGETYAAAYALLARGGVLPFDGRWISP